MSTSELIQAIKLQQISHKAMWNDAHQAVIESIINTYMEGKALVPADVVATVIKDHSFLANGDLMCVYCGESSYHQKDITHKNTCPIKSMLSTIREVK